MSYQIDSELGRRIHEMLVSKNLETPFYVSAKPDPNVLEQLAGAMMRELGMNMNDDSLIETPKRIAKMWTQEIFSGLDYNKFPKATVVEDKFGYDEMVRVRATVNSTCEHHLLPIIGVASVAYIPKKNVIGLSKINRIVDFFSRRPQIQERLTMQIHATLVELLGTENVAVHIDAEHMCVKTRGVQDACSDTVTSKLSGTFRNNPEARQEFFSLVNSHR